MAEEDIRAVERLIEILDLKPIDEDHYRAETDQEEGRLFGGLILAQSVVAAGKTVAKGNIHSLHSYFLRAGKPAMPVEYGVERIREGRTFLTRRVTAYQGGDAIFEASVGFTVGEEGLNHQERMPDVPGPEGQVPWWETLPSPPPAANRKRWNPPIEIRAAGPRNTASPLDELPERAVWTRPWAPLPEDPLLHAATIAYMTDSGMIATVGAAYGGWHPTSASLDHSIWWHHPPRYDDWLLYVTESPAGHNARALIWGGIWNREGVRVASVAQESLFRQSPPLFATR
ncbi:MAG: thioesterase family protein [Dehalococcoidia bacterium]|nr:thioesterase family protein [Dehalococcoidia bacterium]